MSTIATPTPVWLDCDPGHDDCFAILLAAYHPAIRLLGVSTVFGNASLDKTTRNASSFLTAIAKVSSTAVYAGASQPTTRPPLHAPTDIHGESGLDGTALLPPPRTPPAADLRAVPAMAAALSREPPGTAWLVATGALTNVAALFGQHPALAAHIAGLSIMGGAVGGGFSDAVLGAVDGVVRIGNWTPYAEFNILADPEAAAALFGNAVLAAKTTLVPLDVTHQVLATGEVQRLLLYGEGEEIRMDVADGQLQGKTTLRTMLVELLLFFAKTYRTVFGITAGPPLHDPIAVAATLAGTGEHEIPFFDFDSRLPRDQRRPERYEVTVVTEGTTEDARNGAQTGRTLVRLLEPGQEGIRIPRGLDIPKFWKAIEECCQRADAANALLAGARKSTTDSIAAAV